jgi:hypothetical protein
LSLSLSTLSPFLSLSPLLSRIGKSSGVDPMGGNGTQFTRFTQFTNTGYIYIYIHIIPSIYYIYRLWPACKLLRCIYIYNTFYIYIQALACITYTVWRQLYIYYSLSGCVATAACQLIRAPHCALDSTLVRSLRY